MPETADPSAAQRDDITGTLQAAIADPDVAARIGRLTKPERWSGFAEFGDSTAVFATRPPADGTEPDQEVHRPTAETPVKHDAPPSAHSANNARAPRRY